jgi:predicted alpha/beta-fold hydrolase
MTYQPPWWLKNGLIMTIYRGLKTFPQDYPPYQEVIFAGKDHTPIAARVSVPPNPQGTIIATYGITGDLEQEWYLHVLARLAYHQNYGVILFDWRSHGRTLQLSSVRSSDGLNEGHDFVEIAAQAEAYGCHGPIWLAGYSLGGQLAGWGLYYSQHRPDVSIVGAAILCPNLHGTHTLNHLASSVQGRLLEQALVKKLKHIAIEFDHYYPDPTRGNNFEQIDSIRSFDELFVIEALGFATVDDYYEACNLLQLIPQLTKSLLMIYAEDDPFFPPSFIERLRTLEATCPALELILTAHGGHVGFLASKACQEQYGDRNQWWAWHRIMDWINNFEKTPWP